MIWYGLYSSDRLHLREEGGIAPNVSEIGQEEPGWRSCCVEKTLPECLQKPVSTPALVYPRPQVCLVAEGSKFGCVGKVDRCK